METFSMDLLWKITETLICSIQIISRKAPPIIYLLSQYTGPSYSGTIIILLAFVMNGCQFQFFLSFGKPVFVQY